MTDIKTTPEIISELKDILNIKYDKELAAHLNVSKQSLYQYQQKKHPDIQQKIITELLLIIKQH